MSELYNVLISRGEAPAEAKSIIREMRDRVADGENPEEVLYDEGLEPDYIFDLLWI